MKRLWIRVVSKPDWKRAPSDFKIMGYRWNCGNFGLEVSDILTLVTSA